MTMKHNHSQVTSKYRFALMLLVGIWMGVAVAQEAETLKPQQETGSGTSLATPSASNRQSDGVDWSGQHFWLVEMSDMLDRDAVAAAWRNLRARFPKEMENRTILPRRQDLAGVAREESAVRYKLFIANFPEKQIAEEFCAMLHAAQQRCSVVSSQSLALGNVSDATASATDSLGPDQVEKVASEAEPARLMAAQEAEAGRPKAEQEAQTEAQTEKPAAADDKQATATEPEAVPLKTEQEAQAAIVRADTEKKAKAEEKAAAEAEEARENAEKKAQADALAAAEAKAAKLKTPEGIMMEDFAQNVARQKTEQKAQVEAKAAEEAKAAKQKAAKSNMLADLAQKAVLKNPEVLSRWHNFQAAAREIDVARGAYLPSVDLSAGGGRERNQSVFDTTTLNRNSVTLTLTQMLYDGSAAYNEVRRLTNTQLTRYYELLDASESAALEAARAYYDVLRHRKLFALTEDNYVSHRTVFEQIQQKVQAGVGRRVDLEQAAGRLALSEANLVADNANVHDASARFQRIIGELPPATLADSASLGGMIVPNAADAHLSVAVDLHPAVLAAVENVRAARFDLDGRRARYQPRVDFRLSQTRDSNTGGVAGKSRNAAAEVVMNWNLFSGGSDSARVEQYIGRLDAARYQRDKVCRDIRMTLAIAYNDISKLQEQLKFLEQHRLSIEKARGAYQKQFEIGQRSLLDLLDTENEVFQARRSHVNAEHDLAIAHVRTLAGMGRLVSSLKLDRLETVDLPELLGVSSDAPEGCPPEAPLAINIRKEKLDERAIAAAKPPAADGSAQPGQDAKATEEDERFLQLPGEAKAEKIRKEEAARKAEEEAKAQPENKQ